jgi:hypothetical protein
MLQTSVCKQEKNDIVLFFLNCFVTFFRYVFQKRFNGISEVPWDNNAIKQEKTLEK